MKNEMEITIKHCKMMKNEMESNKMFKNVDIWDREQLNIEKNPKKTKTSWLNLNNN